MRTSLLDDLLCKVVQVAISGEAPWLSGLQGGVGKDAMNVVYGSLVVQCDMDRVGCTCSMQESSNFSSCGRRVGHIDGVVKSKAL